jgi:trehalose synthase
VNVILYFSNKKAKSIISLIIVDPEGEMVLKEVHTAAREDPHLKALLLPGDAHRTMNALQRASDILLQETINEGFGQTVTEAM